MRPHSQAGVATRRFFCCCSVCNPRLGAWNILGFGQQYHSVPPPPYHEPHRTASIVPPCLGYLVSYSLQSSSSCSTPAAGSGITAILIAPHVLLVLPSYDSCDITRTGGVYVPVGIFVFLVRTRTSTLQNFARCEVFFVLISYPPYPPVPPYIPKQRE